VNTLNVIGISCVYLHQEEVNAQRDRGFADRTEYGYHGACVIRVSNKMNLMFIGPCIIVIAEE